MTEQTSSGFGITAEDLVKLNESKNVDTLNSKYDGVEGIAKLLKTDLRKGLSKEEADSGFVERRERFGKNVMPQAPAKGFFRLFFDALKDTMLIILMVLAVVSVVLGLAFPERPEDRPWGWVEGAAILFAVFIVSGVTAFNDWRKERKFRALSAREKESIPVKVVRGGEPVKILITELVCGDVVMLEQGNQVPADGILIDGKDLQTDESVMTGESQLVKKNPKAPFMLSGCQVKNGVGTMLVTCVGEFSEWGKTLAKLSEGGDSQTPLEEKLDVLAAQIGKLGVFSAVACFLVLIVGWMIKKLIDYYNLDAEWSLNDLNTIVQFIVIAVTIVVVAVPEGLPLAVTISLAYSVHQMMKEQNLVRHLAACETMGGATTICSDKTGTLTKGEMHITCGYFGGKLFKTEPPKKEELSEDYTKLLAQAISVNSTAFLSESKEDDKQKKDKGQKFAQRLKINGNPTEGALILMVKEILQMDYWKIRNDFAPHVVKNFPFSSQAKRMTTVIKVNDGEIQFYRVHCKGASEIVLGLCSQMLNNDGTITKLDNEKKDWINKNIINPFAELGQRTLTLAYRDYNKSDEVDWDDQEKVEKDLVLLAIVGIEDPLRDDVKASVLQCQKSGIIVRMVTGDNLLTAKKIATDCGIFSPDRDDPNDAVMEGPVFRKYSDDELDAKLPKLRVLARSSPTDKYKLVSRLLAQGEVVAVTGDGTNDAPALKKADVGLAMGSGTEVAKEASDIIIMDDSFSSVVSAVLWGRGVYENIRKFLQFQLTVNVVALLVTIIAAITSFIIPRETPTSHLELPLTAVQLLWVNLIMDTFAALALATEPPIRTLLDKPPYGRNDRLITPRMWVHILGQGLYQLAVLLVLYYAGQAMKLVPEDRFDHDLNAKYIAQKNTLVFNAFVFAQIFNEFNCRKLDPNQWNIIQNLHKGYLFIFIFIVTTLCQVAIVELGRIEVIGRFTQTTGLDWVGWLVSIGIGLLCIPYGFILRLITYLVPEKISPSKKKLEDDK